MRLLPDSVTKTFEIKYSLVDEDGNLIYFDSSGNVVSEDTPGATQYWTVSITNSFYGKTLAYYSSILFTRNNLRSDHKGYYFKTIEYVLGELKGGSSLWHPSARFSYSFS